MGLADAMGEVTSGPQGNSISVDKPEPKAGAIDHMSIDVADNGGFTVTCDCRPKGGKGSMGMGAMLRPEKHVFSDVSELLSFIAKELGGADAEDASDGGDDESAEGGQ